MIDLHQAAKSAVSVPIREAAFPVPFETGLEYAAPARGPWNIVHVGMLLPESRQIFVCAEGCLRGVVLTAAEMGAMDRFSTIAVQENNLLEGDMEQLIIDGTSRILSELPRLPRAVLLFTSCVHHFVGCDLHYVFQKLREKFPAVDFTDCYMNPIMRKSKTPPDAKMRQQLYSFLRPAEQDGGVSLLGTLTPLDEENDLFRLLSGSGRPFRAITSCKTYDGYLELSKSSFGLTINPAAALAGETLEKRLGMRHLHLPLSYDFDEIAANLSRFCEALDIPAPDFAPWRKRAEKALRAAAEALSGVPVAIDYTATTRPLGLAKLLLEHGFAVESVYADSFSAPEKPAFDWLRENAPGLTLHPTVHPVMGMLPRDEADARDGKLLAIGQKAAYFTGTGYFLNLIEGDGHYGFDGIARLAEELAEAAREEKDVPSIIQVKGWGCCG